MKYFALLFVVGLLTAATPAYALERGTGSYLDYLIAKIQQEGLTIPSSSGSQSNTTSPTLTTGTTTSGGGAYDLRPATPTNVANWLRSMQNFSITTINPSVSSGGSVPFGGSSWGGVGMDVNTYHIVGETGGEVQQTYDIAR